ncbi:MAG: formylglycine-generating enzyme family protein [Muribaculaceae bacterium]|nr:formylglycine-generating enzyme family protein [Muribaculaceae bacterium]
MSKKRESILNHAAKFACCLMLVCGVSLTTPHRGPSGVYGDVNGDAVVDVEDINEVINVILKKPHGGEREIVVSEEELTFTGEVGGVYTQSLTVFGKNLSGVVSAAVMGGDGTFDVAPSTVTLAQVEAGAELTVTYAPTSAGSHAARLQLTSDGAPTVTVMLSGTATQSGNVSTTTYTANGVTFEMVTIEGGTFTMGGTPEQGTVNETLLPTHQVTLSSYAIGQTEVTQALWVAVMGSNPSYFNEYGNPDYESYHEGTYYTPNLRRPVERVDWDDCQEFITKLNALTGETFRLPTEAEWEFAARGGNKSQGYMYSGSNVLGEVAWYDGNANTVGSPDYGTHTVATKAPNELGVYDMSGNVWEWCADRFGYYSSDPQTNPTGPATGPYRVFRGGCWARVAGNCRVALRNYAYPYVRSNGTGFRLAK